MRIPYLAIIAAWLVLCMTLPLQAAFTEFYCNASTGNNTYAGSTESSSPVFTATGGNWVSATGVYTKAGSNLSGVSVGMFAAVMVDGGTVAARVGRITAVDDTADTITISTTAGSGSLADQTGTATVNVGGAWKGPNAAVDFPLDLITVACTNAAGDLPRVNLKNNAQYDITAAIVPNQAGPIKVEGYATTVGDAGKAVIDGSTNAIILLNPSTTADDWVYESLTFQNNGTTGANAGVNIAAGVIGNFFNRVKFTNIRGQGLLASNTVSLNEIEVTGCNQSNTSNVGCLQFVGSGQLSNFYIHDNAGTNIIGVYTNASSILTLRNGVIKDCASSGLKMAVGTSYLYVDGVDFYNNSFTGLWLSHGSLTITVHVKNSNFIKNGTGVQANSGGNKIGRLENCGFGSGTQANTFNNTDSLKSIVESGSVTYAANVTPWRDPANGDFTMTLDAAKHAGRGALPGTTNTTGYPAIGAVQPNRDGVSRSRSVNQ